MEFGLSGASNDVIILDIEYMSSIEHLHKLDSSLNLRSAKRGKLSSNVSISGKSLSLSESCIFKHSDRFSANRPDGSKVFSVFRISVKR